MDTPVRTKEDKNTGYWYILNTRGEIVARCNVDVDAREIVEALNNAGHAARVEEVLSFAINNKENFTEHDPDGVKAAWIKQASRLLKGKQ